MKDNVLLIGNGINRIKQNYSWSDLLNDLIKYVKSPYGISTSKKPFPLLYEEIFLNALKNRGINEFELKSKIAELFRNTNYNELQKLLLNLKIKNILTTNYDYNFESVEFSDQKKLKHTEKIKETTYSLFRNYKIKDKYIWHIHGELNYPQSILLGYNHYSGYLQQIRNYFYNVLNYKNENYFPALRVRIENGPIFFQTWIDFFFLSNVYILGLSLDFTEMHLWWILNIRSRLMNSKKNLITNEIYFIIPDNEDLNQDILQLLSINDVKYIPIEMNNNNYEQFYKDAILKIKSKTV